MFCSDSADCPTPPWLLEGESGLSEKAWCKSASERARLVLVRSLFETVEAELETAKAEGGVWGAATPGMAPDCCLSLFCPGNGI